MIKPLEYYYTDGSREQFDKYTIDTLGVVRNKKTGRILRTHKDKSYYNVVNVYNNSEIPRGILIGRALVSTFHGPPPTIKHTADHIDQNPNNETLENVRWLCKKGQGNNRTTPESYKSSFIIIKDGVENTVKDWVEYLKYQKNPFDREYTENMITKYAQKKLHGFSYKVYPDLPGEVWKEITWSNTKIGRWEISDMCRVKYITKYAENVLSDERIGTKNEYPKICINGKHWYCHILAFMIFFPDEYASRRSGDLILHEDDDRLNFRPHKLRLGTQSENIIDAHDNGCYGDKKTARMSCASYVNDILEKNYDSQYDAVKYLKSVGYTKAGKSGISNVLSGKQNTAYGRTWKLST